MNHHLATELLNDWPVSAVEVVVGITLKVDQLPINQEVVIPVITVSTNVLFNNDLLHFPLGPTLGYKLRSLYLANSWHSRYVIRRVTLEQLLIVVAPCL